MRALGVLLLLVLLAGCADRTNVDGTGSHPAPSRSITPDGLVIQVRYGGGLMAPTGRLTEVPLLSVYGDGHVIVPGPVTDVYPGPALPNLRLRHLAPADVDNLVEQGLDAGVGTTGDLGQPQVADAPTTTFYVAGRTTEVDALGIGADANLTPAQRDARRRLQHLLGVLQRLSTGQTVPYVATRVAAVSTPWSGDPDGPPSPPAAVAWPGPQLPGDTTGAYGCAVAAGDQATAVLAAAAKANTLTPWTSAGTRWRVTLRPLLPDESTCADLTR